MESQHTQTFKPSPVQNLGRTHIVTGPTPTDYQSDARSLRLSGQRSRRADLLRLAKTNRFLSY